MDLHLIERAYIAITMLYSDNSTNKYASYNGRLIPSHYSVISSAILCSKQDTTIIIIHNYDRVLLEHACVRHGLGGASEPIVSYLQHRVYVYMVGDLYPCGGVCLRYMVVYVYMVGDLYHILVVVYVYKVVYVYMVYVYKVTFTILVVYQHEDLYHTSGVCIHHHLYWCIILYMLHDHYWWVNFTIIIHVVYMSYTW